jgi:glycosyltransferase involved in cell wall biosynthesis
MKRSEMPMKEDRRQVVALVTDAIYPYFRGGKEVRYYEMSQRLARWADVHVFTMKWWEGPTPRSDGQVTFHATSRLYPMYSGERRSYREALFFAISCFRLFWFHFDVIEVDQFPTFHIFTLRLITWLKGKRLTVTWHEVWDHAYWCEYLGPAGNVAYLIQWLAMRAPDHLIAASTETADRLREVLGKRASVSVVPNGIDLDGIQNSHPDDMRVDLVTVGRLLPHKNVHMLLKCVALLHAAGLPVTCRVIGDGPQRAALHQLAHELGIDHAVDFRHDIWEQKDVYSLIKAARVAVFATAREGFGIAVLEAIACGVPVVTTSAPDNLAQYLVARSASGIVCAPSVVAIADAVRVLLADPHATQDAPRAQFPVQDAWLTEHGWDFAAEQVARVLGFDMEGASDVRRP